MSDYWLFTNCHLHIGITFNVNVSFFQIPMQLSNFNDASLTKCNCWWCVTGWNKEGSRYWCYYKVNTKGGILWYDTSHFHIDLLSGKSSQKHHTVASINLNNSWWEIRGIFSTEAHLCLSATGILLLES